MPRMRAQTLAGSHSIRRHAMYAAFAAQRIASWTRPSRGGKVVRIDPSDTKARAPPGIRLLEVQRPSMGRSGTAGQSWIRRFRTGARVPWLSYLLPADSTRRRRDIDLRLAAGRMAAFLEHGLQIGRSPAKRSDPDRSLRMAYLTSEVRNGHPLCFSGRYWPAHARRQGEVFLYHRL